MVDSVGLGIVDVDVEEPDDSAKLLLDEVPFVVFPLMSAFVFELCVVSMTRGSRLLPCCSSVCLRSEFFSKVSSTSVSVEFCMSINELAEFIRLEVSVCAEACVLVDDVKMLDLFGEAEQAVVSLV